MNEVHGNYYGTNLDQVLAVRDNEQKVCILDIDVKGASDIAKSGLLECNYLFVKTPSMKDLEERLLARRTETKESLLRRLSNAEKEIKFAEDSKLFTKTIINRDTTSFLSEVEHYIVDELYKFN